MTKPFYVIGLFALLTTGCGQAALTTAPTTAHGEMAAQSRATSHEKELKKLFTSIDKNRDGKVTYEEILNAKLPSATGGSTHSEKQQRALKFLEDFDRNHDGVVTLKEFLAAPHDAGAAPSAPSTGPQGVITPPPRPADARGVITPPPAPPMGDMELLFLALDTDGDGRITYQELMAAEWSAGVPAAEKEQRARQFIADFDRNRDGAVTLDEFPAAPQGVIAPPAKR